MPTIVIFAEESLINALAQTESVVKTLFFQATVDAFGDIAPNDVTVVYNPVSGISGESDVLLLCIASRLQRNDDQFKTWAEALRNMLASILGAGKHRQASVDITISLADFFFRFPLNS